MSFGSNLRNNPSQDMCSVCKMGPDSASHLSARAQERATTKSPPVPLNKRAKLEDYMKSRSLPISHQQQSDAQHNQSSLEKNRHEEKSDSISGVDSEAEESSNTSYSSTHDSAAQSHLMAESVEQESPFDTTSVISDDSDEDMWLYELHKPHTIVDFTAPNDFHIFIGRNRMKIVSETHGTKRSLEPDLCLTARKKIFIDYSERRALDKKRSSRHQVSCRSLLLSSPV